MPVSTPAWLEALPENMTEAEYRELSEGISRAIEIVYGHVIKCEPPTPRHNLIARRLSFALETARSPADPCMRVETRVDIVLWRVPRFTFRRPDGPCGPTPISRPAQAKGGGVAWQGRRAAPLVRRRPPGFSGGVPG
jgi:hypothetical protein